MISIEITITLNHYLRLCQNFISGKVLLSLGLRKNYKLKYGLALVPRDTKTILEKVHTPKSGIYLMEEYSKLINIIGNLSFYYFQERHRWDFSKIKLKLWQFRKKSTYSVLFAFHPLKLIART